MDMGFLREVYEDFCKDEDLNSFLLMGNSLFLLIMSVALLVYWVSRSIIILPEVALYVLFVGTVLLLLFISMTVCSVRASCKDVKDAKNAEARYEEIESAVLKHSYQEVCTCSQPDEIENEPPVISTSSSEVVIYHRGANVDL